MSTQMNVRPIDEQNFLKRNALLGLLVGTLFSGEVLYIFLEQILMCNSVIMGILRFSGLVIFILMIVALFKTLNSANRVKKDAFWYGNLQDEYLNYVNLKGYKYVFNFSSFILFLFYVLAGFEGTVISNALLSLELRDFCKLIMSTIFFSYALPVLYLLRGIEDE
ncbi:hypothetical protein KO495_12350 [Colwellia sp. D2M02]|uniref:hypothetical protein n=1 Tax=Colwellia sp. D2M02 TaxID=2841562 RepID=UPI001C093A67|nr:hypothetical protein [Colwellia sp. D2M02]MBU2894104.1 hypothetical protein [Colwellia sp. D2M02]